LSNTKYQLLQYKGNFITGSNINNANNTENIIRQDMDDDDDYRQNKPKRINHASK
jgi:hypothetical protein